MSNILNLETTSTVCSVCLSSGKEIIALREDREGRNHASLLSLFIGDIFKETGIKPQDLNAIAVSKGPGSYTGLRIGVSIAKGMAYGLSIPLISLNTLGIMASGYLSENPHLEKEKDLLLTPVIDARRMEVYSAIYNTSLDKIRDTRAEIITGQSFEKELIQNRMVLFGDGAAKCSGVLENKNIQIDNQFTASSRYMSVLSLKKYEKGEFEDLAYFEPFYLKDFIATIPKNKIF